MKETVETFRISKGSIKMGLFCSSLRHTADMTAMVSVYTIDGFIVGADGFRMDESTGQVKHASVQKLFSFASGEIRLIYGWCGTTQMFNKVGECLFDFIGLSESLLTAASRYGANDLPSFLRFIQTGIYALMTNSKLVKGSESHSFDLNGELARLLIAGYFNGVPFFADVGVRLHDSKIVLPKIQRFCYPLQKSVDVFSGSRLAYVGFETTSPENREEALAFVTDYIQACIEKPDPGKQFGGHVHIAELTPTSFNWIQPPASS
jgi:hypothetical protein